jgi:dTDP-4-amino-4,6-dideoxygalactose transaminase
LEPVFCDVDPKTNHLSVEAVRAVMSEEISAILGVNLWGGTCDPPQLQRLGEECGLPVFFDSAQAFGCGLGGTRLGSYGAAEVFSFHATKIINGGEGGCITTNDDELAARMRNIRSSYGAGPAVDVPITTNGRFSEAQAALALLSLADYDQHQRRNSKTWRRYARQLDAVPGISAIPPCAVDESNWQTISCAIDSDTFGLQRDDLLRVLKAEHVNARRYFYPGCHRSLPYAQSLPQYRESLPDTDALCRTILQLPLGAFVTDEAVDSIAGLVELVQTNAEEISGRLRPQR